jgi:hypothetical protein
MRDTPSYVSNTTTFFLDISVKNRAKETTVSQKAKKKGEKLQFSPDMVIVPRKLFTRSTTKRMNAIHTSQVLDEYLKAFTKTYLPNDKDNLIIDLQNS